VRDELANLGSMAKVAPQELKDACMRAVDRSFRRDGMRRPLVVTTLVEL
jgi:hypothetical protein